MSAGETKHFCCGWCKSGPLSVDVHLPSGGFVPGQAIVGQVQVDNGSTVRVERVVCSLEKVTQRTGGVGGVTEVELVLTEVWLVQEVKWHASGGKTNVTRKAVASTMFSGVVDTHASKVISLVIPVPAVPPSNLFNCNIIDLSYYLRVRSSSSLLDSTCFHSLYPTTLLAGDSRGERNPPQPALPRPRSGRHHPRVRPRRLEQGRAA